MYNYHRSRDKRMLEHTSIQHIYYVQFTYTRSTVCMCDHNGLRVRHKLLYTFVYNGSDTFYNTLEETFSSTWVYRRGFLRDPSDNSHIVRFGNTWANKAACGAASFVSNFCYCTSRYIHCIHHKMQLQKIYNLTFFSKGF